MRKEPQSPWTAAWDRVQAPWGRARRWVASRGSATRVGLLVAGLAVAGLAGYLATGEQASGSVAATPLYEGQRLSRDDLRGITAALDAESILYRQDSAARRVLVRTDRKTAALAAIAKHKAAPATLDDLNRDDEPASPWLTAAERESHEQHKLEQLLKRQIEELDAPILSALVRIRRDKVRGSNWNGRSSVHASVYLQVEDRRKLTPRTVDGIETFLKLALTDLTTDAITVADQTGHKYMVAGDAPLNEENRKHSREEEWSEKIADGLRHIPGVGVSVSLESVAVPPPAPAEPPPLPPVEVVVTNGSLGVTPELRPVVAPSSPPVTKTRANVWVRVPRSFYLMAAQSQTPGHTPSAEDLQQMRITTERIAHEAVDASIPRDLQGDIKVAIVQDVTAARNVTLPGDAESNPFWPIPAVAVSGVGLALVASVVTGFRLAAKRPALRPSHPWRPGFVADEPNPGPAERVRELIRLNPEAAAGVLQRWIGQGGTVG